MYIYYNIPIGISSVADYKVVWNLESNDKLTIAPYMTYSHDSVPCTVTKA